MMKLLIGLLILGNFCAGYAEIRTESFLEPIQQEIANSPKETLVLLDVGGTLLEYPDAILHPSHEKWKYDWFQTHCPTLSSKEKIAFDRIVLGTLGQWKLLDAQWPEVILQAQNHGVKVVAFTKVAMDQSVRGLRSQILQSLGIPFKDDLPELSKGNFYEYAHGVIETEYKSKGPVLKEVLSSLKTRPEKIIFVDDRMSQIKSVHEAYCELEIQCTAFHYVPIISAPQLNEKIADHQLSTLVHEHRWVHDNEARFELEQRETPYLIPKS
jgi:histidinol phosphatase-like enzyme